MFPILSAAPPPGEEDPEDEENDTEGDSENPKHFAVQVGLFTCFTAFTHSPCTHLALSQSNIYDMICVPLQVIDTMALHMPPEKLFNQLVSKQKHTLYGLAIVGKVD